VWGEEGGGRRCNPIYILGLGGEFERKKMQSYRVWKDEVGGRRCDSIGCGRRRWEEEVESVCDTK